MPYELKWVKIKKGNYSGIFTINQGFQLRRETKKGLDFHYEFWD